MNWCSRSSRVRSRGSSVQLARVTKREQPLLGFVNTGVTSSDYTAFQVPDPDFLPCHQLRRAAGDGLQPAGGRHGRDRYLLTNQTGDAGEIVGRSSRPCARQPTASCCSSGALTWAHGPAAAVGFLPTQNDQDVLGNMLVDPNAATYARGQLFQDRSHIGEDRRHLPVPGAHPPRRDRPIPGRPAVRAPPDRAGSHAGTHRRPRVRERRNGVHATSARWISACRRPLRPAAPKSPRVLDVYNLPNMRQRSQRIRRQRTDVSHADRACSRRARRWPACA